MERPDNDVVQELVDILQHFLKQVRKTEKGKPVISRNIESRIESLQNYCAGGRPALPPEATDEEKALAETLSECERMMNGKASINEDEVLKEFELMQPPSSR
jgi:hypothetical protein